MKKNYVVRFIGFLFIALIALGIVMVRYQRLSSPKTASFVIPAKQQYKIGEVFPLKIEINGLQTSINTVQADIRFDPKKVEALGVSSEKSFATIVVQKELNNTFGYVRVTGGVPNPGFAEASGLFSTIYFKAKEAGVVTFEYLPSSMVLANDGKGTNVLKDFVAMSYVILPEHISPQEQQKPFTSEPAVSGAEINSTYMDFSVEK